MLHYEISESTPQSLFRSILLRHKLTISFLVFIAMFWAIDLSLRPYLLKIILDKAQDTPDHISWHSIVYPIAIFLFLTIFHNILFRLYDYLMLKFKPALKKNLVKDLMAYCMSHSYSFFQERFSGSISSKMSNVSEGVGIIIEIGINRFLSQFLAIIVALITLYYVHFMFSLVFMVWIMVSLWHIQYMSKHIVKLSKNVSDASVEVNGKIIDTITNMIAIRSFNSYQRELKMLEGFLGERVKKEAEIEWFLLKNWVLVGVNFVTALGVSFYFLVNGLIQGHLTPGDFALIIFLYTSISESLWGLSFLVSQFSRLWGQVNQGLEDLTKLHEIRDDDNANPLVVPRGEIVFYNVSFKYKNSPMLFERQNTVINPHEKIGLVGLSGSGKSTFAHLLMRHFEPQEGRIIIDGQDIKQATLSSLRQNISYIPQEPVLFHQSLLENIQYGCDFATNDMIVEAAKKAQIHNTISKLPNGYNTIVGERGLKLSGGERQRIIIARAFLKNSPIFILDEATSAVDSITEDQIQKNLYRLMENKTVIVIAHRLSTLLRMDRILVFKKGKIIEEGSHNNLLAKGAAYAALWNMQVDSYLEQDVNT